ncbi:CST complex subunit TEN1 [Sesamum angolense]|uniref:CST complex subunit TEN1 n=1 Tax=Sesamum angolense TaxID=2727404 RepID=A0AAE2C1P6_9LAMI|nr:CST complex subunit TEN1 [Sesamum angolense]
MVRLKFSTVEVEVIEMGTSAVSAGALVTLQELNPSSPTSGKVPPLELLEITMEFDRLFSSSFFRLQDYDLETAVAVIVDGDASLNVDTKHLKLNLRSGSMARVGRIVDGLDINLYRQSLQLLREFQAEQITPLLVNQNQIVHEADPSRVV